MLDAMSRCVEDRIRRWTIQVGLCDLEARGLFQARPALTSGRRKAGKLIVSGSQTCGSDERELT